MTSAIATLMLSACLGRGAGSYDPFVAKFGLSARLSGAISCAARAGRPVDTGNGSPGWAYQVPESDPYRAFWIATARKFWKSDMPSERPEDVNRWIGDIAVTMLDRAASELRWLDTRCASEAKALGYVAP